MTALVLPVDGVYLITQYMVDTNAPVRGAVTWADVIGLIGAPLLALVVGLVTKMSTHPGLKAWLLLALSFADGMFTEFLAGPDNFDLRWALLKTGAAFLIAAGANRGLFQPTGISAWVQGKGNKDPAPDPSH